MVSLAIEEVIPPDMERLATGTVSAGAGVDGEAEIVAKHELEVGGMEALVLLDSGATCKGGLHLCVG
jgi:hypothetical protein